jgi:hypothetical protein
MTTPTPRRPEEIPNPELDPMRFSDEPPNPGDPSMPPFEPPPDDPRLDPKLPHEIERPPIGV